MDIRCELWRLLMRLLAVEHLANRLTLVRRQGRNEHQRFFFNLDTTEGGRDAIGWYHEK